MININNEFEVGEKVFDDLTAKEAVIVGISFARGFVKEDRLCNNQDCLVYWVDNDYLGGGRHPWELTKLKCCGNCKYAGEGVCDNHEGEWAGEISTYFRCEKFQLKEE